MLGRIDRQMLAAGPEARYDANAKMLLGEKIILAHILAGCVEEFANMDPQDVYKRQRYIRDINRRSDMKKCRKQRGALTIEASISYSIFMMIVVTFLYIMRIVYALSLIHIFIEQNGRLYQKNVSFGSNDNLLNVILNIVSKVNRTVNEANPIVDARLLDGSRVNVVLPPIALDGPTVTIRKFPEDPMTVKKLIEYGSITPEVAELLERMVKAKFNIFIRGGPGLSLIHIYIPRVYDFFAEGATVYTVMDYIAVYKSARRFPVGRTLKV